MKTKEVRVNSSDLASKPDEQQEQLLMAFADNECGFFGRIRARRLLSSSAEARKFLDKMHEVSGKAATAIVRERGTGSRYEPKGPDSADLWGTVSARIMQEERSEILLGHRRTAGEGKVFGGGFEAIWDYVRIGGVSALAAAAAVLIVVGLLPVQRNASVGRSASVHNQAFEPVSFDTESHVTNLRPEAMASLDTDGTIYYSMADRPADLPHAFEVDWMKSRGRVSILNHPGDRSAIFWVKRDGGRSRGGSGRVAGPGSITPEFGNSSSAPIRVLDDRAPSAISVVDR